MSITSGVRYILTGFCNYFDPKTKSAWFRETYDEKYDGSAAGAARIRTLGGVHEGATERAYQRAMGADLENARRERNEDRGDGDGLRIGDILRAVWVYDDDQPSPLHSSPSSSVSSVSSEGVVLESDAVSDLGDASSVTDSRGDRTRLGTFVEMDPVTPVGLGGRFVRLDGLSCIEKQKVVAHLGASISRPCHVLVSSDNAEEEDNEDNEAQRNIPRIASKLLSTAGFWSFDEEMEEKPLTT